MLLNSGWRVLRVIGSRRISIQNLAKELGTSLSWTSEIISQLEAEDFVVKHRGRTHYVSCATTSHAVSLQSLITEVPGLDYGKYMHGKRIKFAWTLLYEPKTVPEAASVAGVHVQAAYGFLRELRSRGLLVKKENTYVLNRKLLLWEFLDKYRNYSKLPVRVLWKLADEMLVQTREEIEGVAGGFGAFPKLGVMMYGIHYDYYVPKRVLSTEEIAVQSLVQLDDARLLALAVTFILKHRLTYKRLEKYAVKYDCRGRLKDIFTVIASRERRIETERLPAITRSELDETLKMYDVK